MRPGCRAGWWRRAKLVAPALCAVAVAACVTAACAGAVTPERSPTGQLAQHAAPVPWEHFAEAKAWPTIVEAFAARGHGTGEQLIDVRVSPAFLADYRGLTASRSMPAGTIIVAFHRNRVTGDAGSVYAMSKQGGASWEYLVATPDGAIEARGALRLCARCHAEAPADSVFGVRASAAHPPELPEAAPRSPSN